MTVDDSVSVKWVWFFIPLPEPLGLPEKFVWREYRNVAAEELNAIEDVDPSIAPDPFSPRLKASVLLWDRPDAISLEERLGPLFDTAQDAFPGIVPNASPDTPDLRGHLMIAEVAVPLLGPTEELTEAFDTSLEAIRHLQQLYEFVTNQPLTPAFIGQMPPFVPYVISSIDLETGRPDVGGATLSMFMLNLTSISRVTREPALEGDRLEKFTGMAEDAERVPYWPYVKTRHRAYSLIENQGDLSLGVAMADTAAQLLLDTTLKHLCWEESMLPKDCAAIFQTSALASRIKRFYSGRLGGGWDLTGSGAVGRYNDVLREVRHRVVHAGYEPTVQEARSAYEALLGLDTFVADRLAATQRTYPRTARAFLGVEGFEIRLGHVPRHLRHLMNGPEPDWYDTFDKWRFRVDAILNPELHQRGGLETTEVLVLVEDGAWKSVVYDSATRCVTDYDLDVKEAVQMVIQDMIDTQESRGDDIDKQLVLRVVGAPESDRMSDDWAPSHQVLHAEHLYHHDPPWLR